MPLACTGQGYTPPESSTTVLGVSQSASVLQQQLVRSRNWRNRWKVSPATACSTAQQNGNLCASAGGTETEDQYAQMMLASSPWIYSSINPKDTQGRKLVRPPGNQGTCSACVAFAVTAAAETALATFHQVDVANCSISVQALFFCQNQNKPNDCASGELIVLNSMFSLQGEHHTFGGLQRSITICFVRSISVHRQPDTNRPEPCF